MKKKLAMLSVSVVTLILEALPYGAVCNFMSDCGGSIRRTYSYFDLTPFGYANFAPLITAVLSCAVCLLCLLRFWKDNKALNRAVAVLAGLSAVTSLLPLALGLAYMTTVSFLVTASILVLLVLSVIKGRVPR